MKLLVVGDVSGTFLLNFVKYLKLVDKDIVVDTLNINEHPDAAQKAKNTDHFRRVFSYSRSFGFIDHIPKIRGVFREVFQFWLEAVILKKYDYDIVMLFGMWPISCRLINRMKKAAPFWVGVIMGSDYLKRNTRRDKSSFLKAIRKCDRAIVANPHLFKQICNEQIIDSGKLRNVFFGLEPLEALAGMQHIGAVSAKKHFNISAETLVITCGYSGSPNQQHSAIINALRHACKLPKNHLVVFPMTYGGNIEYKLQVEQAICESGLNFRILKQFLSDQEIALWRKATDIFIQVQHTDAFSGSMQEHLFCGNIVITGSWLPYQELKNKGIEFFEIDTINEISKTIDRIIPALSTIQANMRRSNTPDKFSHALWKNSIGDWYKILMEYKS